MIRAHIEAATAYPDPIAIRPVAEWYKDNLHSNTDLTAAEKEYIEKRWVHLISKLAEDLSVPVGWLAWSVSQLVEYELRLAQAAVQEGEAALAAGGPKNLGGS